MSETITFSVFGLPAPKGSKNQFGGESSKRLKPWMEDIRIVAAQAMQGHEMMRGPVHLTITFVFPYRKSDYNSKGELKENAPRYRTSKPDLDKLERGVYDALTGIVYLDDAQVVHNDTVKKYGHRPAAHIVVHG